MIHDPNPITEQAEDDFIRAIESLLQDWGEVAVCDIGDWVGSHPYSNNSEAAEAAQSLYMDRRMSFAKVEIKFGTKYFLKK